MLSFQAVVADGDGDEGAVVAYDWRSDLDGPLGSEAAFSLRGGLLTAGQHVISVRALNDEGTWSETITRTITVRDAHHVLLPLVLGNRGHAMYQIR